MKRHTALFLAISLAAAACGGGSGALGTLPPASPSADPSGPVASPDATPGGSIPGDASPSPTTPGAATSPPGASAPPTAAPGATQPPVGRTIVRAYFHLGGDVRTEGLVPVLRDIPQTQGVARAAMLELLRGPAGMETMDGAGISTAIPAGSQLLGISIADGVATVDLSGTFASGGGSASSMIRLAQVTYTLTQFPTVNAVSFRLDGRPVTVFGSEGIVLDGPVAREDFHDLLPSVWVDRPAWGAALGNPGRVTGLANTFEAQFHVAVLDNDGISIADESVMATCGTGCWGTFDVSIRYSVREGQWGALRTYNYSAEDGSVIDVRDYPVWLTPGG